AEMSSPLKQFSSILPRGSLAYINGSWVDSRSRSVFPVTNPFNKELVATTANCDVDDARLAVESARNAFSKWSRETTPRDRSAILSRWFRIIEREKENLAKLLTLEQGKPLAEARGEIDYSNSFLDWYSGEARRVYGQVVPAPVLNREHLHIREPIGVVALITPWNFPTAMIARKAAAALSVGCTLVIKPAEDTPLSALAFAQTGEEAGIPKGVINVLPSDRSNSASIGRFLCESTDVDAISFTGSTGVGKILLSQSASTVKRVCLELGGNAPLLVFPSADLDVAVKGTMASKFRGSGQTCVSANRLFVHSSIAKEYVEKLKTAMSSLKTGDGLQNGTTQGPLINDRAVAKTEELLKDATDKGAKIVLGGTRGTGCCFEPTLLTGITPQMRIAHEEIFAPIAAIHEFEDEAEVVARANSTRSGLAGYLFSRDQSQIYRVTRSMQVGMIGVNEGLMSCAEAAFGGVKESGLGREGSGQGIDEFTQWKYICQQH
ncbi:hypothetical protein PMAYCL1PPCAC_07256, partial [Pristionchus mayeri]